MKNHYLFSVKVDCIITFLLVAIASPVAADSSIHDIWSTLLNKHVKDGVVNYSAFKEDETDLDVYLAALDNTDPAVLDRQNQLALYINAYNAYTVKLILKNFSNGKPVTSIKRIGGIFSGPWKIEFCRIGGKTYTLDNIEHDIIRPQFQDPRIHFAVNCASKSCPPLISEAYKAETLDQQLESSTTAFINDSEHNYLEGSTLNVSKIFKWFSEDFTNGSLAFFRQYAQGELSKELQRNDLSVDYLDYDWSLNGM